MPCVFFMYSTATAFFIFRSGLSDRRINCNRICKVLLYKYVDVLISLWLFLFPIFLFAVQLKEFLLDGLKKFEQRSHKCVELRGEYVE
jgi:hypothetical protein